MRNFKTWVILVIGGGDGFEMGGGGVDTPLRTMFGELRFLDSHTT